MTKSAFPAHRLVMLTDLYRDHTVKSRAEGVL
jgi:hypothetical protein